ncbi:hypothetical protein A3G55_03960 [Candidatus Giovannonibacteria bacterium RIFCSPLOWO2_12_FULL_44_25]|uniref:Uncharacterized protein n=4 Tax=Candidatus Giovannoniibacteriota TaxID=1752738 RepID=A0A0G1ICB0_9BACT|nr:MAG: hypothetical protein UW15_C0040G0003 [Parcubacteria group bacterium GW2011_GWC1_44_10]KKT57016.1 MAG: hypothetical protein UW49_C0009G0037 [Candidatus Giovannonibacteria bacterium GW2011_GWB1_44_23]KKT59626.1 MAG: hypothetical protein UW53_C0010G0036 [Candidatus Giovannonibacteria bacterium GW2011_GWA1_44_25]KKT82815.1 MAG: hypothetical protein UW81_C0035G0002 [Candidatus Giovannonibacteria bacterium GW2011_GWC2_44_9]OGF49827.1 MAG: hypothetical protein A2120_01245 [Candidatus Giovannon
MDATTLSWIVVITGALAAAAIALFCEKKVDRAVFVCTVVLLTSLLLFAGTIENYIGTPAYLEVGNGYVYEVLPERDEVTAPKTEVVRVIDQDGEIALYEMQCDRFRGGCESIPRDGTPFYVLRSPSDGGYIIVTLPKDFSPQKKLKKKDK